MYSKPGLLLLVFERTSTRSVIYVHFLGVGRIPLVLVFCGSQNHVRMRDVLKAGQDAEIPIGTGHISMV